MDHTDLYFLQSSDHPRLVLVSQPFDGDNYNTWLRTITISLNAKNKLGFVNGTIKSLSDKDSKYPLWRHCKNMVMAWLLNALTPALPNSVIYADIDAEIWSDLQDRFSLGNLTHVFQIRRTITEHK
ncbi:hypothetical protein L3X38_001729 [Prunus dulcis]|uniref:Retrotransposon Copia-like N-terminal domain-containing protein n=1 Tax=Prunus dulcis TaxID=3755 RepID=A0AAD4WV52_PRUDU|nr:hypothetical protein L3X38_001729 [Prunus dulcis]